MDLKMGEGRKVSLSYFVAWKIAKAGSIDEEQLNGLDDFARYMVEEKMAEARTLNEWAEWYDAYWVQAGEKEIA